MDEDKQLLELYAGLAMLGLIIKGAPLSPETAVIAFRMATNMLDARSKNGRS